MTADEKRASVVKKIYTRKNKNTYTQDSRRSQVATGFGDCSSTCRWAYRSALGIDIGSYTQAQILSTKMVDVPLKIINGIPDESKMLPGDLLYFRGHNEQRYLGVGHVEMYTGNGKIMGHGSGIGPTEKVMKDYCRIMQNKKSKSKKLKNCGLIKVRRVILVDDPVKKTETLSNPAIEKILKGYTGVSVVDAFVKAKQDSSKTNRKKWAEKVGIKNYVGTAAQNKQLIISLGGTYK